MMAFGTRRLNGWASSIRALFKSSRPPPAGTNTSLDPSHGYPGQDTGDGIDPADKAKSLDQATEGKMDETDHEPSLSERMEQAKKLYPGFKEWAKDEERLFEILYLRQDIPMLPSNWNIDFRGFPIPENVFATSDEHSPIVYAHSTSGSKGFSATAAITRLIDVTLSVRTIIESSQSPHKPADQKRTRQKSAKRIKDSLDRYIAWASRDGGYDKLRIVPNIVAEIVDTSETQDDIVQFMMERMRALVHLQREFYREDRDENFWTTTEPGILGSASKPRSSERKRKIRAGMKRGQDTRPDTPDLCSDELASDSPETVPTPRRWLDSTPKKKRRITGKPGSLKDELADFDLLKPKPDPDQDYEHGASVGESHTGERSVAVKEEPIDDEEALPAPGVPLTPPGDVRFRRKPPVVYGLYVLGTSVFMLTADASKGDAGYISFHVDVNFADKHQSVWNALTVAMAVCSARDELMGRLDDFKPVTVVCDSDPDA